MPRGSKSKSKLPARNQRPLRLPATAWRKALKQTFKELRGNILTDRAAALTYYSVQAIFPGLLVFVSIIGLTGRSVITTLVDDLHHVAPGPAHTLLVSVLHDIGRTRSTAGVLVAVGLIGAIWSASSYVGAFIRASNAIYGIKEKRSFWKLTPLRVGLTALLVVLLAVSSTAVVLSGDFAVQVRKWTGLPAVTVTIWDYAKWPVLAIAISFTISLLYWLSPAVKPRGFRWVTPGGLGAVTIWLVTSVAFALYVGNFASYNKTYGALAGVIIFLVWLWISNLALLLGVKLNAELGAVRNKI